MRLFLSSYRLGANGGEALQEILGEDTKIGVITNAKDYKPIADRTRSVNELFDSFSEWDIEAVEIDLRPFFGQPDLLELELQKYSCIWLAGGNTFILRKALRASGADTLLTGMVKRGELLYGGESAGAVVAAPTLQGVEFGDDPYIEVDGYDDEDIWEGLGLIPYSIVPHYESDWEGFERMIEVLEEANMPYKTLTDSQVLLVDGDQETRL